MNPPTPAPLLLQAFRTAPSPFRLVPAPAARPWMDATDRHFAERCLPLLMANQGGWEIQSGHRVRATWDGGVRPESTQVQCVGPLPAYAFSHFGYGMVTWTLPWLFRTPPGWGLLVRGPANRPKDGLSALEGWVETDWAVSPFTMNWQITRAGLEVGWEAGEAIALLVPCRLGDLEQWTPRACALEADPALHHTVRAWMASRRAFNQALQEPGAPATWQKHYFQGKTAEGQRVTPQHWTKLTLQEFEG